MQQIDMSHVLGTIAKWGIILVAVGFSIALSYMFFLTIAPPDKPWFPWAALSLTEGGFILWMVVFMLTHHSPVAKSLALVMTCACAVCSLSVAGYEFYMLLAVKYDIAQNTGVIQTVSILLEVIFCFHFIALIIDLFASYFARPGNNFRNRNLIPLNRNLIPTNGVSIQELEAMRDAVTGQIESIRDGVTADPLVSRQLPQPHEDAMVFSQLAEVAKGAVSSATKKVKGFTKRGKKADPAPGQTNTNTDANGLTNEDLQSLMQMYKDSNDGFTMSFPEWVEQLRKAVPVSEFNSDGGTE